MVTMATMGSTYSFSSQPKPVSASRKKYRDPAESPGKPTIYRDLKETCITWDKRVHRGNTYSIRSHAARDEQQATPEPSPKLRRRRLPKEISPYEIPMPVPERIPVDLTSHLVAKEVIVELAVVESQTDEFLPEPPPEQYQPQKTGVDMSTQVEDGEVFDFDLEAEPILDVLVSKTIEQSIMEVEEEYEMDVMKEFKENWYRRQAKMMEEWQKQVDEERVCWERKEEILREKRAEKQREARVLLKIQAVAAAKRHLADLVPNAVRDLRENAFPDEKALAINRIFLPELMGQVLAEAHAIQERKKHAESEVQAFMQQVLASQGQALEVLDKVSRERQRRLFEDQQIRRGKIRILVDDGQGGKVHVGPIKISSQDSVQEIEERVYSWLMTNYAEAANACPHGVALCIEGMPVEATKQIFEAKSGQISIQAKPEPAPLPEEVEGGDEEADTPEDADPEAGED